MCLQSRRAVFGIASVGSWTVLSFSSSGGGGDYPWDAVSVSQLVSPVWCAQQLAVLARKPVTRFAGDVPCTLATLPPEQCELACSPSKTEATQAQLQAVRKSEETPDSKCPAR